MKKLLIIAIIAGLGYGVYWFFTQAQQKTAEGEGATKKSQKAMEELEKEGAK
jgi:uncharacterized protein HemX